jgi:DNA-binding NarL/FixJ family response regulator
MRITINVLGISDRADVQRQLRQWIDQDPLLGSNFSIATQREAPARLAERHPAVTLWDFDLDPQRSGLASTALHLARQTSRVLALAAHANDALLQRLLALGLMGCVEYHDAPVVLCPAVYAVHRGELWLPRRVLSSVCLEMNLLHAGCADEHAALSMREREILVWVSHGLMNKEIALRLGISDKTVKTHLQRIFKKTHLHHRAQLAAQAAAAP